MIRSARRPLYSSSSFKRFDSISSGNNIHYAKDLTMDLERGDENMNQESVQRLLSLVSIELSSRTKKPSPSIYMAPDILRNLSESSFIPRIVSIGPLHRDDENLKAFEAQKVSCLANLFSRIDVPNEEILKACMESVYASMEQIKACYVWPTKVYPYPEIAEMMVLDACFILEFICCRMDYDLSEDKSSESYQLSRAIYFDLVLLENQIPFFILDQIYQCTLFKCPGNPLQLNDLIIELLKVVKLLDIPVKRDNIPTETPSHILSLLHEYYKPPSDITSVPFPQINFQSTVDFALAWVNIETDHKCREWELKIAVKLGRFSSFFGSWSKHTLIVPKLYVNDFTEVILRNLIAYEQSYQTRNYITSYAFAMDMLVNTQEDVANLVKSKALTNDMGSNEEVANMINNICKNVMCEEFYYEQQCIKLDAYCNACWPKNIARLRRNYFNSPWNIIALGAGFILFALTVVQTIFSVKSTM
ncbi:hypothetical protein M8C21_025481 [Ambrosia artemisiifolia]|uniref:Uncharacterized protein n=1 Tax=Ambrosia artemisiifolia TaxID=4212 RepID=A0AAD5GAF8_AMBAR|nr:hypothetical protein M8C21_025481 [Ambrosia artemisiifolia]